MNNRLKIVEPSVSLSPDFVAEPPLSRGPMETTASEVTSQDLSLEQPLASVEDQPLGDRSPNLSPAQMAAKEAIAEVRSAPRGMGEVWAAAKPVLRVMTLPWWWPVGYLFRTIAAAPARIKSAFLSPYRLMDGSLRLDRARWEQWNVVERMSVMRQAFCWFLVLAGTFAAAFSVPGAWKLLPLAGFVLAWRMRWTFDVVRFCLGLPQVNSDGSPKHLAQESPASGSSEA